MKNHVIEDIRNKITCFDNNFNNTAADSCAFNKVLSSGLLFDQICSYISNESAEVNESLEDFKYRLALFAVECVNQIYKPYGRIVREEEVFYDYFNVLFDSLLMDCIDYS